MKTEDGIGPAITLEAIAAALAMREAKMIPAGGRRHGAVAMLLRDSAAGPQMLFIERARCPGDPWSGDLGFPGGKVEAMDATPRQAAEREVLEEIGLPLADARFMGQLDDISGAHLPIVVSCFAWALSGPAPLTLSRETAAAFWVPVTRLLDPDRQVETTVYFAGEPLVRPAIRLLDPGRAVLWGITYRLVSQLLGRLTPNFPAPAGGGKVF